MRTAAHGMLGLLLLFTFVSKCGAQKEDVQWLTGSYRYDFSSGNLVVSNDTLLGLSQFSYGYGNLCSTYSNRNTGHLLFVSDGANVWNSKRALTPHGSYLDGDYYSMLSSALVACPMPGSENKYYLFRCYGSSHTLPSIQSLVYSIVDMTADSGWGDVELNSIPVSVDTIPFNTGSQPSMAITAARNGCNVWVVFHSSHDRLFYAYLITPTGVCSSPVISPSGPGTGFSGGISVSQNGDWLCSNIADHIGNSIELYAFNNATGVVGTCIPLLRPLGSLADISSSCFAASGNKLYVSYNRESQNSRIVQYDLSLRDSALICNSGETIFDSLGKQSGGGEMKLAIDGKIYVSFSGTAAGVINSPEELGSNCLFSLDTLVSSLDGRFQHIIESPPNSPYHTGKCDTALMADFVEEPSPGCNDLCVELADKSTFTASHWQWLSPGGHPALSTSARPTICYDTAGVYPVTLIASGLTGTDTITKLVRAASASGSLTLTHETDTTVRSGDVLRLPISYNLPGRFNYHIPFLRLSFGLSYDSRMLRLPISEVASRVLPDTGWVLLSIDSTAGMLRFVYADTGFYPPSLPLVRELKSNVLPLGTFRFDCVSTGLDTTTVRLSYCRLETSQETFGFCDDLENGRIAQVVIQGKSGVAVGLADGAWRVTPNPAGGKSFRVEIPSEYVGGHLSFVLYDLLGRERLKKDAIGAAQPIEFMTAGLEEGTYNLRIESEGEVHTEKIEIVR